MKALVDNLIQSGVLKTQRIIEAFLANDRRNFVLPDMSADAYADAPLPISKGQTISQPYTVAFMMELLEPRLGQKILDVGFGSGWTTAILASIVGDKGKVFGLEIVPELFEFGRGNIQRAGRDNVELFLQSGWDGLLQAASFDRILVSATADREPEKLKAQLAVGGRMVVPIGSPYSAAVTLFEKIGKHKFNKQEYPGFAFVPLVPHP